MTIFIFITFYSTIFPYTFRLCVYLIVIPDYLNSAALVGNFSNPRAMLNELSTIELGGYRVTSGLESATIRNSPFTRFPLALQYYSVHLSAPLGVSGCLPLCKFLHAATPRNPVTDLHAPTHPTRRVPVSPPRALCAKKIVCLYECELCSRMCIHETTGQ